MLEVPGGPLFLEYSCIIWDIFFAVASFLYCEESSQRISKYFESCPAMSHMTSVISSWAEPSSLRPTLGASCSWGWGPAAGRRCWHCSPAARGWGIPACHGPEFKAYLVHSQGTSLFLEQGCHWGIAASRQSVCLGLVMNCYCLRFIFEPEPGSETRLQDSD